LGPPTRRNYWPGLLSGINGKALISATESDRKELSAQIGWRSQPSEACAWLSSYSQRLGVALFGFGRSEAFVKLQGPPKLAQAQLPISIHLPNIET
jgi:hypothetical protein